MMTRRTLAWSSALALVALGGAAAAPAGATTAGAPFVKITAPEDGATYRAGVELRAWFRCFPDGEKVSACTGTVANGATFDTSAPGVHAFTVTATGDAGGSRTKTIHYTIVKSAAARHK